MDPNECIEQGIRAAERGDYETATQQLISYDGWLTGGGFSADEELVGELHRLLEEHDTTGPVGDWLSELSPRTRDDVDDDFDDFIAAQEGPDEWD